MSDQTTPLVTVITPTYNRADYLPETIESVLSQDYPNIEYIVLDDGSADHTIDVLKQYERRILWQAHPNMGETRTVNKAFEMAKGDYFIVVNSDDPILPGLISTAVEMMQQHPDVLVAYPDWVMIDADSKPIREYETPDYDYITMLRTHFCNPGPGAMIRRKAYMLEGGRDPQFRYVADYDYWLRVGLHGAFIRIPQILATFRVHPGSATQAQKGLLMAQEHLTMLDQLYSRPNLPAEVLAIRKEAYSAAHYIAGTILYMNQQFADARPYYLNALRLHWQSARKHPYFMRQLMQTLIPAPIYQRLRQIKRTLKPA